MSRKGKGGVNNWGNGEVLGRSAEIRDGCGLLR